MNNHSFYFIIKEHFYSRKQQSNCNSLDIVLVVIAIIYNLFITINKQTDYTRLAVLIHVFGTIIVVATIEFSMIYCS